MLLVLHTTHVLLHYTFFLSVLQELKGQKTEIFAEISFFAKFGEKFIIVLNRFEI